MYYFNIDISISRQKAYNTAVQLYYFFSDDNVIVTQYALFYPMVTRQLPWHVAACMILSIEPSYRHHVVVAQYQ